MLLSLALAAATPAAAQDFQSTPVLDAIVAQFTGVGIGEQGGARTPVDKRLRLQACAAPQLEWRSAAKDAVVVRCMAPAWRIYVPVDAVPQPRPVPDSAAPAPVVAVKAAPVIRRGDPITVEAGSPGFSISRDGIAMGDAAAGARLMVKVDDRKPPIQAVALEPGRARLPGWAE
ncbi:flagella basal body P-ring formation protein FlgA [Sphingomonas sp. DG1-23]|uniref:flagella basal body P-ring formation protein FlgA n=1 Tax=Sphingomonas sp. DG1-23 TaxID=3068316 RepID=UPI00273F2D25|nr:flagella basal body P-ring formation protein FlgA [Sphingomonas sp. DG1-23]MDP5280395.1 flagella basal body P-ring formation protein FlgA [Sphingomonas sp. DG1-23]